MPENYPKHEEFEKNRNEKHDGSFKGVSELFTRHAKSLNTTPREGFKQALKARIKEAREKPMTNQAFSWMRGMPAKLAAGGVTGVIILIISVIKFVKGPELNLNFSPNTKSKKSCIK